MQRVIKFRAWDGKEMHYKLSYIGNGTERGNVVMAAEKPLVSAVLMQFTGQLDKNKKEIYEGDIRLEMLEGLFVGDAEREHYFVLVYIQEWTMFAWLSITAGEYQKYLAEGADSLETEMYWTFPSGHDEPNNINVVGNIFQNKNLLQ